MNIQSMLSSRRADGKRLPLWVCGFVWIIKNEKKKVMDFTESNSLFIGVD